MINCCSLPRAPELCFRVPDDYVEFLSMLPDYNSCAAGRINYTDRSANLLHAAPIKHDPYTPDSMDSPSPNAMIIASADVDASEAGTAASHVAPHALNLSRRVDRAVSPALLKSKLELIKRQEADADQEPPADIKRSPSDCCLHSWPQNEDRQWTARTNRCNSDVSWQRSHVLTQAWIQGKGEQGYHSFGDRFADKSSVSSTPLEGEALPTDLIIPRISIINASNFESNESSVYLHEDKYSNYSDNKLTTYSDGRTKSLSGEAISSEKSDELYEKLDESNRLNRQSGKEGDLFLHNLGELIASRDAVVASLFETKLDKEKLSEENKDYALEDNEKLSIKSDAKLADSIRTSLVLHDETRQESLVEARSEAEERSTRNEIEVCNENVASKTTTGSASLQGQDNGDNAGNARLRSKACKVTERCKHNIVRKKGRCRRCCCIVS